MRSGTPGPRHHDAFSKWRVFGRVGIRLRPTPVENLRLGAWVSCIRRDSGRLYSSILLQGFREVLGPSPWAQVAICEMSVEADLVSSGYSGSDAHLIARLKQSLWLVKACAVKSR